MLTNTKHDLASIIAFMFLVFLPLKMFTFKFGLNLGFSRLFLALGIILVLILTLVDVRRSKPYFLPRAYFSNKMCLLLIFAGLSLIYSYLSFNRIEEAHRILIMGISFLESTMILPAIFFLLLNSNRRRHQIILKAVWCWRIAIYFAILQFVLFLVGLPLSYESIGEPALENIASVGGATFLRLNSFFGEPRDLAALLIPIMMFHCIVQDRALRVAEKWLIFVVGVLTFSNTLVIALGVCFFLRVVMSKSAAKRTMNMSLILAVLVAIGITFVFFREWIFSVLPRLAIIPDIIGSDLLTGSGDKIDGDLAQQISDFLILPYIFSGDFLRLEHLLGHGLGSSQLVLRDLAETYFDYSNPGVLFGSRFIIFTLLLDIGLIGCLILLKVSSDLIKDVSMKSKSQKIFQYYSYCIIAVSLFNDSYFFVCYLMFLAVLKGSHRESDYLQENKIMSVR